MSEMVNVRKEDLERSLERLSRARYVGITPGEKMAEDRLRSALESQGEPEEAPEEKRELPEGATLHDVLPEQASLLVEMGFSTIQDVRDATDEELLAIDGIGPAKLRKVREALS